MTRISELVEVDGAEPWTLDLSDGRTLRVKVLPDYDYTINDYDTAGRISAFQDYFQDGRKPRPDGFTGRARKVPVRGGFVWWEPYAELTDEQIREELPRIRELLEMGFSGIVVEVLDGADAYGSPIVRQEASLWGCDLVGAYADIQSRVREIVAELLSEVGISDEQNGLDCPPENKEETK